MSLVEWSQIQSPNSWAPRKLVLAHGCFDLLHLGHIRHLEEAKRQGVQNVMVTHALTNPGGPLTLSEIQQAAKLGAYIELVYGGLSEDLLRRDAEVIRAVGASSVVLSTDLGQPNNPLHTDGLLAFYKGLIAQGISEADIVQMSQTNPAKLLGLKP